MKILKIAAFQIFFVSVLMFNAIEANALVQEKAENLAKALNTTAFSDDLKGVKDLISLGAKVNGKYEGTMPLMAATISGHREIVKALINYGANVNMHTEAQGSRNMTPLMMAVSLGHTEIVELLLKAKASVSAKDEGGFTPLLYLPYNFSGKGYDPVKYASIIKALLAYGADPNYIAEKENPILLDAAVKGNEEAVRMLLAAGAIVNAKNEAGETALMYAALSESPRTLKLLLTAGAKVNSKDRTGTTALMNAAMVGDAEAVRLLLAAGADVNAKKESGVTAYLFAKAARHDQIVLILKNAGAQYISTQKDQEIGEWPERVLLEAVRKRDIDKTAVLLAAGDYANGIDRYGNTTLMIAAEGSNYSFDDSTSKNGFEVDFYIVKMLLSAGADVNAKNDHGKTALMVALNRGSYTIEIIKALIDAGSDVNAKDEYGQTALLIDAESNRYSPAVTRVLLSAGADVNVKDLDGHTPLARYTTEFRGSDSFFLVLTAIYSLNRITEDLLSSGADLYLRTDEGKAELNNILDALDDLEGYEISILKILATSIKNRDLIRTDAVYESIFSLPYAIDYTNFWIIKLFAEPGWFHQRDESGSTVLIALVSSDDEVNDAVRKYFCLRAMKALLSAGADVNAQDEENGMTALMHAARRGNFKSVKLLLDAGANLKIKDKEGQTVFDHVNEKDGSILKLLKRSIKPQRHKEKL